MHTPGKWINSPNACDAIVSTAPLAIAEFRERGGPYVEETLKYYGGAVIAESIAPRDRPIIMSAPLLLEYLYWALQHVALLPKPTDEQRRNFDRTEENATALVRKLIGLLPREEEEEGKS